MADATRSLLSQFLTAIGSGADVAAVGLPPGGSLPSAFAVSDLAQASIGAAGAALSGLVATAGRPPSVTVDRDLASAW
ncbi:MAG TPA: hypothetical protein VF320_11215, partial [Acidimicrobiales bacterium]